MISQYIGSYQISKHPHVSASYVYENRIKSGTTHIQIRLVTLIDAIIR
jgi:hypothetical protein